MDKVKDRIFREPLSQLSGFQFDEQVAEVFDDMLDRSIPFYDEVGKMILEFVGHYYQASSSIYDLGCSTGILLGALIKRFPMIHELVGLDNSPAMIHKTQSRLEPLNFAGKLQLQCKNLRDAKLSNASVVIMNYTLQFVRPLHRNKVVASVYQGLLPGGIFILSEKVLEESNQVSRLFIDMYYRFKRRQGYSEMEISQKRERLENVLVPYTVSELQEILQESGFNEADIFFKWHNFASIIAIKQL